MNATLFASACLRDDDVVTAMETFAAVYARTPSPVSIPATRWSWLAEAEQFDAVGEYWATEVATEMRAWCEREALDDEIRWFDNPWIHPSIEDAPRHIQPMSGLGEGDFWSPDARIDQVADRVWVIDGVLRPDALAEVHASLSQSTIWRTPYVDRYCGAFLDRGLASRTFGHLIDDLRRHAPGIGLGYRVVQAWAFRCEATSPGIGVHADRSDMNINLWTTPDWHCRSAETSGLTIWPVRAPGGTPFETINGDVDWCRRFVARSGIEPIHIPYRANRAVVFDGSQFHASSGSDFEGGVDGRRINVTVLLRDRSS